MASCPGKANGGVVATTVAAAGCSASTTWALPAIAAVNIWQYTGYNMLFFLAGLQGIPPDFYEAASLDGASPVEKFFNDTISSPADVTFIALASYL